MRNVRTRGRVMACWRCDDDPTALADQGERLGDVLGLGHVGGDHAGVGQLTPRQFRDDQPGLVGVGEGVRRPEFQGLLPFEGHRVDREDVATTGRPSALHRVDADAADAHDHRGVARLERRGAHGGPAGAARTALVA
ncbi:MAG TPA: hypothetical protein VHU88_06440 [Sporichthyaceae bacterium]|nr:hypothetical protein [Sporichthyaceae bacterium]